jgi:hypothetical protein
MEQTVHHQAFAGVTLQRHSTTDARRHLPIRKQDSGDSVVVESKAVSKELFSALAG